MKYLPLLLVLLAFIGCKTEYVTEYIPVYHSDTVRIVTYDSIDNYIHDSIYVYNTNDTFLVERWHVQTKYVMKRDTIREVVRDSVLWPIEVVKEVNKPTILQQCLEAIGAIAVLLFIAAIINSVRK